MTKDCRVCSILDMETLICGVIKGPTYDKAHEQLVEGKKYCDMVELRLDYFDTIDLNEIKKIDFPKILTLRSQEQGGKYEGTEEERLKQLKELITLNPEYIDIEYSVPFDAKNIIRSYHDFQKMPPPDEILKVMLKGDIYKMAFTLNSSVEALQLLQFMKKHPNVVAMGMGIYSEATRVLAPIFGAKFVYASIDSESAPGQIPAEILSRVYHFSDINPSTSIYGVIGYPIDKSPGPLAHNAVMHELQLNSVYVRFPVLPEHLRDFIEEAKRTNIKGLSVTMPLKEDIIPYLDEIDPWAKRIGAVNTLVFKDGKIKGYNTDGKGALDSIEEKVKVKGKKVVIIGAGGASKAIIGEAIDRGAQVTILNRDPQRAQELAEKMNCQWGSLDQIGDYDILINATAVPDPIDPKYILPNRLFMDINSRFMNTPLLNAAEEKVYGYEMYVNQAVEQVKLWFGESAGVKEIIQKRLNYGK